VLFDDMELLDDDVVSMEGLIQPKIEAEIAFVVGRSLEGRAPSYGEFLGSLAYALPALEIVDSAIRDWKITLVDTIADNASCGLFVLGLQPVALGQHDFAAVTMQLDRNGRTESTGNGAACLGHPLRAAFWLARTMAAREQGLRAGQVILSGALGPMVPLAPGDEVEARLGPLGTVRCRASGSGATA
jgi:2-keto-4-pentenoate hydratase